MVLSNFSTVVRYFSSGSYTMATGWMKNSKGEKWYFTPSTGIMYRGLKKIGAYYYYFDGTTGAAKSGFLTAANEMSVISAERPM